MSTADIPLRNMFYMLAYAWNQSAFKDRIPVGEESDGPETPAFFAKVLCLGCDQLFSRGLDRVYHHNKEEIAGVRGRIAIGDTLRRDLLRRGRTICEFDELQYDALHNRLLKATLHQLLLTKGLATDVSRKIRDTIRRFDAFGVSDIRLTKQAFRQVQLHRNNAFYGFLMRLAEFVAAQLFPTEGGSSRQFAKLIDDEQKLNLIFEAFVRNFYRAEQKIYRLREGSERLDWDLAGELSAIDEGFLPGMYPDMTLRSRAKTIVIDAKYYRNTFTTRFDPSRRKIHSGNLYQLFTYLKNLEANGGHDASADGILLYPQIDEAVSLAYTVQGHVMRISTIDLSASWQHIAKSLLSLVDLSQVESAAA